jgi:hypothetical protein
MKRGFNPLPHGRGSVWNAACSRNAAGPAETRVAPAHVSPLPPRSQVLTFLRLPLRSSLRVSAPPRQIHALFGPDSVGCGRGSMQPAYREART